MPSLNPHNMSLRGFCLCCMGATTLAATAGWLTPRQAFAKARNIVDLIRDNAAKAPIKIHKIRATIAGQRPHRFQSTTCIRRSRGPLACFRPNSRAAKCLALWVEPPRA
jgi:hypothetical protein